MSKCLLRKTGWLALLLSLTLPAVGRSQGKKPSGEKSPPARPQRTATEDPNAAAALLLESAYKGERAPEAVRMLSAVLRGSRMGPGEGWFGPSQVRYSWEWLARHCGVDPAKGAISRDRFRGSAAWFARLDRDKNGAISPDDFDWSDRSPYLQRAAMANRFYRKLNAGGNGQLTKEELLKFFNGAAKGKDHLTAEDFRDALLAGSSPRSRSGEMPSQAMLIRGLFAGELGSMSEGPKLNESAPDFTLKTADGKDVVQLAKRIGPKPVVLVFGSFT